MYRYYYANIEVACVQPFIVYSRVIEALPLCGTSLKHVNVASVSLHSCVHVPGRYLPASE